VRTMIISLGLLAISYPTCAQTPLATLWSVKNYQGTETQISGDTPNLGNQNTSSLTVQNASGMWSIFWESINYDSSDDQLWVQGNAELAYLTGISRPHGTNNWNDLISAVSFRSVGPWDYNTPSNENSTVCYENEPCVVNAERREENHPIFGNPQPNNGWFIRVCPGETAAQEIKLSAGPSHDDNLRHYWRNWRRGDPSTFDFPMDLLYVRDVWLKGEAIPNGQHVDFCVGFHDHISWSYTFHADEDHQPDQNDHDDCDC
jgi:hypothetical protein